MKSQEKEYWRNREYFERVLPVPPFYEKNNPDGAITWFKDNEDAFQIAVKNQLEDAAIITKEL